MRGGMAWMVGVALVGCGPELEIEPEPDDGDGSTAATSVEPEDASSGGDDDEDDGFDDGGWGGPDLPDPELPEPPDDDLKPPTLDCSSLDPSRVYMAGSVDGAAAVGDAVLPGESCVGFEWGVHHPTVSADGTLMFAEGREGRVLRFVQDDWWWNGQAWSYPQLPEDNDMAVPSPCVSGSPSAFVLRPSDGAVVYACPDREYRDQFGDLVVDRSGQLLSIDSSGAVLFADASENLTMYGHDLVILDAGQPLPIEFDAEFEDAEVVIWRRHELGWWVVLAVEDTLHRWFVDVNVVEYEGEYPSTPVDLEAYGNGRGANVLDGEGHLYQTAHPADSAVLDRVYVLHRTLQGDATQVLYAPPEPQEVGRWADVVPDYTSLFSGG